MFVVHDMKNKCSTEHANHATKLQKLWLAHALTVIRKKNPKGFGPSILQLSLLSKTTLPTPKLASATTSKILSHIISVRHSKLTAVKANICYEWQMFLQMHRHKMLFERKKACRRTAGKHSKLCVENAQFECVMAGKSTPLHKRLQTNALMSKHNSSNDKHTFSAHLMKRV